MPSARTTETLIRNAVAAFQAAGLTVCAVEVLPKGGVRVIALEAVAPLTSDSGENLCDAVFGVESD